MDLGIKNRVAIVTGSSKGIGKAIAKALSEEGAHVVICSRDMAKLNETASDIEQSTGKKVLAVETDLTKKNDITTLVNRTVQHFGKVDMLINNTGGPPSMVFSETTDMDWNHAVDQLMMSIIHCCREVIPHMKKKSWGRIINMTSFAAKQPQEGLILSNAIRAGILGLTKTLSNEYAADNILINAVCPGWTLTERLSELAKSKAEKTSREYQEIIDEWTRKIPVSRLADPKEIANLVTFLASERASYITGNTVQVDGGYIKSIF